MHDDRNIMERFLDYMQETWKNKFMAIGGIVIGVLSMCLDGDATVLVFMAMLGIPLFFTKKNWVY